ncbi:hypothetical protein EMIT0194MI4_170080 [Pseudomonas sp. IT-194MI4]
MLSSSKFQIFFMKFNYLPLTQFQTPR